jgi:hypothetical protein
MVKELAGGGASKPPPLESGGHDKEILESDDDDDMSDDDDGRDSEFSLSRRIAENVFPPLMTVRKIKPSRVATTVNLIYKRVPTDCCQPIREVMKAYKDGGKEMLNLAPSENPTVPSCQDQGILMKRSLYNLPALNLRTVPTIRAW